VGAAVVAAFALGLEVGAAVLGLEVKAASCKAEVEADSCSMLTSWSPSWIVDLGK
jgi:hypothetical protein